MAVIWPDAGHFYIVDVFSDRPYQGNQLAVVFGSYDDAAMLAITREMNYSETTFVSPPLDDGRVPIRIFTPGGEIPFAGHPTLGTAYVLRGQLGYVPSPLVLQEGVGPIPVRVERISTQSDRYWMRQNAPVFGPPVDPKMVAEQLSLPESDLDARYPIQQVSTGLPALIVPLVSVDAVRRARLNPQVATPAGAPGTLVFAQGAERLGHDVHVRVFVAGLGIPEDPATGSANGCLAAYLAQHVGIYRAVAEQGLELERPSTLYLAASDAPDGLTIEVGGHVAPVAEGRMMA